MTEEMRENPVTGERLRVLGSTPERFRVHYALRPRSEIAGAHFHPGKEQEGTALADEMHLRIDGRHCVLRAGESTTVPLGAHHFQWNPGDVEVVAIEEVRPAGRLHEFFAALFGLARDGRCDAHGRPSLMLNAILFAEFRDCVRHAPLGTRLLLDALAPLASALGYRQQLRPYLGAARRA